MNSADPSNETAYSRLIARAWADNEFLQKLRSSPREALTEMGMNVPAGVSVVMVEDVPDKVHVVIPVKPSDQKMAHTNLNRTYVFECWGPPRQIN